MRHVVIIGAGPSGAAAADALSRASPPVRVTVLESAPRVGGRTLSQALTCAPASVDLGGQWVGTKQDVALRTAEELGLSLRPQHHKGKRVLALTGKPFTTYTGLIPNASLSVLIDAQLTLLLLDLLRFLLWLFPSGSLSRWADARSVAAFTRARMWTAGGRALVAIVVQGLFGHEPEDVSVLALCRYVNGSGSIEAMSEVGPGTLQAFTVDGGMQQVTQRLLARSGATCLVDHRVMAVHRLPTDAAVGSSGNAPPTVAIMCENGSRFEAHGVILALPPPLARTISFSPPLSPTRDVLLNRATMGCIIKSIAVYPSPFWREAGFSGEVIAETSRGGAEPVFNIFDNCVMRKDGGGDVSSLVIFINGARAAEWSARPASERRSAVLSQLASYFGPAALSPLEYVEKDWVCDPHTRGCPIASFAPGVLSAFGIAAALSAPEWPTSGGAHLLHWAGTEASTTSCGFVDGALRAGAAAAQRILAGGGSGGGGSGSVNVRVASPASLSASGAAVTVPREGDDARANALLLA